MSSIGSDDVPAVDVFDGLGLRESLIRGIRSFGLSNLCEVQQRTLRAVLDGRDAIGQMQSGTSITATLLIGVLQRIDYECGECQAVILAPTRELAQQIHDEAQALSDYLCLKCHCCVGGKLVREADAVNRLREGQHLVVGTAYRVMCMMSERHLHVENVGCLVLYEADEMLRRGFEDSVGRIFKMLPVVVQVCLFSATLPNKVRDLGRSMMRDPLWIADKSELTLRDIRHFYVAVERDEWKLGTLCDLCETFPISEAVIYCNSWHIAGYVACEMKKQDFTVMTMDVDSDQEERQRSKRNFRSGLPRVSILTDSFARGIDVPQVSLVVNYDLPSPSNVENYLQRTGQSGSFDRKCAAINFVTNGDLQTMKDIERIYHMQVEELPSNYEDWI